MFNARSRFIGVRRSFTPPRAPKRPPPSRHPPRACRAGLSIEASVKLEAPRRRRVTSPLSSPLCVKFRPPPLVRPDAASPCACNRNPAIAGLRPPAVFGPGATCNRNIYVAPPSLPRDLKVAATKDPEICEIRPPPRSQNRKPLSLNPQLLGATKRSAGGSTLNHSMPRF